MNRFWSKVVATPNGCWEWRGIKRIGYGQFHFQGKQVQAHRLSYELLVAPIPEGLTIDHLCRNRACVNPAHLEPILIRENILRGTGPTARNAVKTHCKRGHLLDLFNIYRHPDGRRECRICKRLRRQRRLRITEAASTYLHCLGGGTKREGRRR